VVVFLRDVFFCTELDTQPQTTTWPTTPSYHDEVRKNGISYAVGLMRSIAYRRICLVNRKTAIVAKMTPHVGISSELIKPFVRSLSCDPLGRVTIRPRVIRYVLG
jgi:hypothetical protein